MRVFIIYLFCLIFCAIISNNSTLAVCPICTIAAGAGIGMSRWLGFDDLITGSWIGGLTMSLALWSKIWMNKNLGIKFFCDIYTIVFAYHLLLLVSMYYGNFIGDTYNVVFIFNCSVDKLLFGIASGSVAVALSTMLYNIMKKYNNNHSYFPFQKVLMPISIILSIDLFFYFFFIV